MVRYLSKSIWLLLFSVIICCVLYPLVLWVVGQVFFPFKANGSLVRGPDGAVVIRCGVVSMFEGKIGRRKNRIAVRIEREVIRQRDGDRS